MGGNNVFHFGFDFRVYEKVLSSFVTPECPQLVSNCTQLESFPVIQKIIFVLSLRIQIGNKVIKLGSNAIKHLWEAWESSIKQLVRVRSCPHVLKMPFPHSENIPCLLQFGDFLFFFLDIEKQLLFLADDTARVWGDLESSLPVRLMQWGGQECWLHSTSLYLSLKGISQHIPIPGEHPCFPSLQAFLHQQNRE